jgi:hypothetical protein
VRPSDVGRALVIRSREASLPPVPFRGGNGRQKPARDCKPRLSAVVRIAISQAAFDAIAKTLPLGSVGYENATNEKGERLIWLAAGRPWRGSRRR